MGLDFYRPGWRRGEQLVNEFTEERRGSILVVDDRPENVLTLEAVLAPLDQNVDHAYSGREALRKVLETDYDLILLDVSMPDMDGFETAQLLRDREKSRDIPLVFVSAMNKLSEDVLHGFEMGAIDYVTKPFDPAVMRAKVAALLEKRKLELDMRTRLAKLEDQLDMLTQKVDRREPGHTDRRGSDRLRAQVEALENSHRLKSELFGIVSHELKTPLSVVGGLADTLLKNQEISGEQRRRALESIRRQAQRMDSLVRNLLDATRLLDPEPRTRLDVARTVDRVAAEVVDLDGLKGVSITARIAPDCSVAMDQDALNLILINLMGNAVKFAHPNTQVVVEGARVRDETVISVTNTGYPIPQDERESIFDPFVQSRSLPTSGRGGVGFGLHIVKRFCEAYGGRVDVECTETTVTFTVRLPAV